MKNILTSLLALMVAMPLAAAAGRYAPATRRMHVGKEFEQFESIYLYDNDARFYDVLTMHRSAAHASIRLTPDAVRGQQKADSLGESLTRLWNNAK